MDFYLEARREAFIKLRLLGATPYDNHRKMSIGGRFEGMPLIDSLVLRHPHLDAEYWLQAIGEGRLLYGDKNVEDPQQRVHAGAYITHIVPNTVEPDVSLDLTVLYEDASMIIINKPAPLPVHPCGRFNHNSFISLAKRAWPDLELRPVHRLDANTTGVLVFAKNKDAARILTDAFSQHRVDKYYLAEVFGRVEDESFSFSAAIGKDRCELGARKLSDDRAKNEHATTEFFRLGQNEELSLLLVKPQTGRTNQIRLHLESLGYPIVGDRVYQGETLTKEKTLTTDTPLHLHAWKLQFKHPLTKVSVIVETECPKWAKTY